jgi:hypothetical protein
MMKPIRKTLLLFLTVLLSACGSHSPLECFEGGGSVQSKEVELPAFSKIVTYDNIDLYLLNGTGQRAVVHAAGNMIPKIEMNVAEGVLTVRNKNGCGWSRPPGNPDIYIYSDSLKRIEIYGYSNVYTPEAYNIKTFSMYTYGTGNFDMNIEGDSLYVESEFIANFKIAGAVKFLSVHFTNDSQFYGKDLKAQDIIVNHHGSNLIEVFPEDLLKGALESTGSLYYYNNPVQLEVKVLGSGKLVAKY